MKKKMLMPLAILMAMLFTAFNAVAEGPVKWTASAKMSSKTEGVITITANIEKGWHIYGLDQIEDGPVATSFDFSITPGLTFVQKIKATQKPVQEMDDMFGTTVSYWEGTVTFTRRFKLSKKTKKASNTIKITYMCCNDSSCRPPQTDEITVKIK